MFGGCFNNKKDDNCNKIVGSIKMITCLKSCIEAWDYVRALSVHVINNNDNKNNLVSSMAKRNN